MNARECAIDLPERQRRARFSRSEQRALQAHFAVCESCRRDRQLLTDFEELDTVDPQDGARIAALAALARCGVARAPVASSKPRSKAKLARVLVLAAALVLLVGSALASTRRWRRTPEPNRASAVGVSGSASSPRAVTVRPSPSADSAVGAASTRASAEPSASSAPSSSPARSPELATAAMLLRQAGDALRRGERDPAALLYRKLQAQYPASAEAALSHVSLGRILAERGQPRAAVREFDRYLSGTGGGVLIPEALYGRARALTALGDRAEEVRTWQRLLRDFPGSAYGEPARRRLAELE